ncbi:hypothetical protein PAAG_01156 [Paracoccidioides lutzii Pb01]|uniref:Cell wall protein n=1 Tax=Paracoccidioides lutzii (strain ATCC MYA-826 / Pb01) TaxID=502779 RepID=C1GRL1_PARBA|nr:hypothetical protein PAAG_01156 [Paracoccidioides lutzii Pb01]EEH38235.1 hypothetical protein PAAG_01156 [Paracoccidioides lutzii Pb01]
MKIQKLLQALSLATLASARPLPHKSPGSRLRVREFPQELSHFKFVSSVQELLQLDNPNQIEDAVFGLLDNEGAAAGAGQIEDLDCLQQAIADQAFTNAKATGNIQGMTDALIYRALERNTGTVGEASARCESIEAVNPEIAAISQHQDPASEDAAEINKQITLNLAVQIASISGNPLQAIESGTFEPGDVNDATGAGNTCNTEGDEEGCIFTENLLVPDVSEDEINAAVAEAVIDVNAADVNADAEPVPDQCSAAVAQALEKAAKTTAITTTKEKATATAAATTTATTSGTVAAITTTTSTSSAAVSTESANNRVQGIQNEANIVEPAIKGGEGNRNEAGRVGSSNRASNQLVSSGFFSSHSSPSISSSSASDLALIVLDLDFGICVGGNPLIVFNNNLYSPVDLTFFNHSSVVSIDILIIFICSTLSNTCFASSSVIEACLLGQSLAANKFGLAAADAFNSAFLLLIDI